MNAPTTTGGRTALETARAKVAEAVSQTDAAFLMRHEIAQAFFLGLVAQLHVLVMGIHGTGKSKLLEVLFGFLPHRAWTVQLMADTPPSAVFGAIDMARVKASGVFRSNPAGTLREAKYAYFREIFKAPDQTLKGCLTALQEGVYEELGTVETLPLDFAVGDSNELPGGRTDALASDMRAVYDRFPLKFWLGRLSLGQQRRLRRMMADGTAGRVANPVQLTDGDVEVLRAAKAAIQVSDAAHAALDAMALELHAVVDVSERAWGKGIEIAKAAAVLAGASEVLPAHLSILQHVLWDVPDEQAPVRRAVLRQTAPQAEQALAFLDAAHAAAEGVRPLLAKLFDGTASGDDAERARAASKVIAQSGASIRHLCGPADDRARARWLKEATPDELVIEGIRAEATDIWTDLEDALVRYAGKSRLMGGGR